MSALDELPGKIEDEVDGNANVSSSKVFDAEGIEDAESVEDDDDREEDQRGPSEVGLEGGLEDERISVDTLCLKSVVEFNVGDTDAGPGEETGNRR